jgi:hypothetical protein
VANPLSRKGSIWTAAFIAVVLVGGAYYLSGHSLPRTSLANAASTQEMLKEYAAKDTDNDGMPDWEEALYCTDSNNAHSVRSDITDAQAIAQGLKTPCYAGQGVTASSTTIDVAGQIPAPAAASNSLTDQFAKLFFDNYMSTRGTTPPSAAEMQTFVQSAIASLAQTQVRTDAYAASDLHVSGTGTEALKTYAAEVERAMGSNSPNLPYSEITYFSDAEQKNDAQAVKNIALIAKGYADTSAAIAKVAVPAEMATQHLALVNAMARLSGTIADLGTIQTDPIRAMLGLQQYPKDGGSLVDALTGIRDVFNAKAVSISSGETGYHFYTLVMTAQSTAQTP